MVKIWWSYLERVMSYRADKQVITSHTNGRMDGRTHRQTQPTAIAESQNWPRVKMAHSDIRVQLPFGVPTPLTHALQTVSDWLATKRQQQQCTYHAIRTAQCATGDFLNCVSHSQWIQNVRRAHFVFESDVLCLISIWPMNITNSFFLIEIDLVVSRDLT